MLQSPVVKKLMRALCAVFFQIYFATISALSLTDPLPTIMLRDQT